MHTSANIDVYLTIQSNPIIEHCSSVAFAAYPYSLLPSVEERSLSVNVRASKTVDLLESCDTKVRSEQTSVSTRLFAHPVLGFS